jgi:hypothetical protein
LNRLIQLTELAGFKSIEKYYDYKQIK